MSFFRVFMFAWRFADFCKIRSLNHRKILDFKKKFKQNEFCIEELGHFENWSIKKTTKSSKSMETHGLASEVGNAAMYICVSEFHYRNIL